MATYSTETVTRTVRRWIIPAAEPFGAAAEEVSKAWTAASSAYRAANNLDEAVLLGGDALWFHVTDDAIVISFETEEPAK